MLTLTVPYGRNDVAPISGPRPKETGHFTHHLLKHCGSSDPCNMSNYLVRETCEEALGYTEKGKVKPSLPVVSTKAPGM